MIYLSFILPSYNVADYLQDSLNSLAKLPQDEIEVIVVNDGSTDNTLEVAQSYIGKIKNLKIHNQVNQKISAARNNGYRLATGNYVHFFDPDDIIDTEEFQPIWEEIKNNSLDIIVGNGYFYKDGKRIKLITQDSERKKLGTVTGPEYYKSSTKSKEYTQYCWLYFLRREFLIQNDIMFTDGIKHEDKEFSAKCFSCAKTVKYIPANFILYRQRSDSVSHSPGRFYSPDSIEAYRVVISNLITRYQKSIDEGEKYVLNRIIAECFTTIYRRIPKMRKYKVSGVEDYDWKYINSSDAFKHLTFKNKLLVWEKRFKALLR